MKRLLLVFVPLLSWAWWPFLPSRRVRMLKPHSSYQSGLDSSCQVALVEGVAPSLFSLPGLERAARSYWRFLSRLSLGLLWVSYGESRTLYCGPLPMLRFSAPHYFLDTEIATVRWFIEGGLLCASPGGSLEISFYSPSAHGWSRVELRVVDFSPALPSSLYQLSQRLLHVFVTRAFLRSLPRLPLPSSRAHRFS